MFESHAHQFIKIVECGKDENKQKRGRIGPFFKNKERYFEPSHVASQQKWPASAAAADTKFRKANNFFVKIFAKHFWRKKTLEQKYNSSFEENVYSGQDEDEGGRAQILF